MSDGRLSEAELHMALNPLTAPSGGAGGWIADVCAVLGLALLAALLITFIFERIAGRREVVGAQEPDLVDTFERLRGAPDDTRRLELFRMLRARAPEAAAELRPALFDPSKAFDASRVEALIRQAGSPRD